MSPVRIGIAGLGSMGQNHLRILAARSDVDLVGVCDMSPGVAEAAALATGARAYATPAAMLDAAELQALVIATPTTTHSELALDAITRGIPVLIEKPLAATTDEAMEILERSRAAGVAVQVGHVERFNPALIALGKALAAGWLSRVYSISSRRAGPFPARIRDVGVTIDLATHDVDILSWVVGERPSRVYAETSRRIHATHEDLLFGLLRFPSGANGFVDVNWLTPTKRRELLVVGEEGMFELDYLSQRLSFTRHTDLAHPRLIGGYAPTFAGEQIELAVEHAEPLGAELQAFIRSVETGSPTVVNAEDGLWAVATAEALLRSDSTREPADLTDLGARVAAIAAEPAPR